MTLTLTLVRHGQTVFNARRHLQGACDSPLTRTGRAGVRVTAQHLARHPFDAAWSSPQGRAVQTSVELLRHHPDLTLRVDAGLREFSFGRWEQRPEHELDAQQPWAELVAEVLGGRHPGLDGGGEPGGAFMARVHDVFARIVATEQAATTTADRHVLVVGHGLTLGAYLATLDPSRLVPLPNASVSTVEVGDDGRARIVAAGVDVAGHGLVAARPAPATEATTGTTAPSPATAAPVATPAG